MSEPRPVFPFSAIVAQDAMKLALLLNAIHPAIGGVLISGTRGAAKSTAVRALAGLLPAPTPFVDLPVGATEDRVLGTLDIESALQRGERRFEPGLLARAHNGILYIDEVNLLPDHLVDVILDAAAMGVNRVERDGISYEHDARIVLIGTMNPEEGELRPQLLDRFGLCAAAEALADGRMRKEAVLRRMAFEANPAAFCEAYAAAQRRLAGRIVQARQILGDVVVGEDLLDAIVEMAAAAGADGLRADLSLHRAVRAMAAWEGRTAATADDLAAVAELALAHRRRRQDRPQPPQQPPPRPEGGPPQTSTSTDADGSDRPNAPQPRVTLGFGTARAVAWNTASHSRMQAPKTGAGSRGGAGMRVAPRGRMRATANRTSSIAFPETLRTAARRRTGGGPLLPVRVTECVWKMRFQKPRRLVVFAVDASGSMAAMARMRAAKAAALSLLEKSYRERCLVAVISFQGESATVLLPPSRSGYQAFQRLRAMPNGGSTPLAEGLRCAANLIRKSLHKDGRIEPCLVLITDGRATHPKSGAWPEAAGEAIEIGRRKWPALCVDTESGLVRLGQTRILAGLLGADYVHADRLPQAQWGPIVEEWLRQW